MERKVAFSWWGRAGGREDLSAGGGGAGGGEGRGSGCWGRDLARGPGEGSPGLRKQGAGRDTDPQGWEKNVALDGAITREMPERKTAPGVKHLPREGGGDVAGSSL